MRFRLGGGAVRRVAGSMFRSRRAAGAAGAAPARKRLGAPVAGAPNLGPDYPHKTMPRM